MLSLKRRKPKPSSQGSGELSTVMLVVLMSLSVLLTSCAKVTKLYPITDKDIYFQENGNVCFSQFYMETVLRAKVGK